MREVKCRMEQRCLHADSWYCDFCKNNENRYAVADRFQHKTWPDGTAPKMEEA